MKDGTRYTGSLSSFIEKYAGHTLTIGDKSRVYASGSPEKYPKGQIDYEKASYWVGQLNQMLLNALLKMSGHKDEPAQRTMMLFTTELGSFIETQDYVINGLRNQLSTYYQHYVDSEQRRKDDFENYQEEIKRLTQRIEDMEEYYASPDYSGSKVPKP